MKRIAIAFSAAFLLNACSQSNDFDASGNFEADEVIVSSQQSVRSMSE